MTTPEQNTSALVGVHKFAEIVGRSRWWTAKKLREWLKEQKRGGPRRVFRSKTKKRLLFTNLSTIYREFPEIGRDRGLQRKLKDHERDISFLTRRVDTLMDEVSSLRRAVTARRAS